MGKCMGANTRLLNDDGKTFLKTGRDVEVSELPEALQNCSVTLETRQQDDCGFTQSK